MNHFKKGNLVVIVEEVAGEGTSINKGDLGIYIGKVSKSLHRVYLLKGKIFVSFFENEFMKANK